MEKDQKDSQSAAAVAAKPPAVAGSTNVPAELGEKSAGAARPAVGDLFEGLFGGRWLPMRVLHTGLTMFLGEGVPHGEPRGAFIYGAGNWRGLKKIGNSEIAQNAPISPPQVPGTTKTGGTIEGSNPLLSSPSKSADPLGTAPQKPESPYNSDPQFLLNNPPPPCGRPGELQVGDLVEIPLGAGERWFVGEVVSLSTRRDYFFAKVLHPTLGPIEVARWVSDEGKVWRRVVEVAPPDVEAARARLAARVAAAGKKPTELPDVEIAGVDVCGEYPAAERARDAVEFFRPAAVYERLRSDVDTRMAILSEKVRDPERFALLSLALGAVLDLVADFLEVSDEN